MQILRLTPNDSNFVRSVTSNNQSNSVYDIIWLDKWFNKDYLLRYDKLKECMFDKNKKWFKEP